MAESLPLSPVIGAQAFLMSMRREWMIKYPGRDQRECTVPIWNLMNSADRAIIVRSVQVALNAAVEAAKTSSSSNKQQEGA
jgi:hypothetical protein